MEMIHKRAVDKWHKIVYYGAGDKGTEDCSYCQKFIENECLGCPVRAKTGQSECAGTPYRRIYRQSDAAMQRIMELLEYKFIQEVANEFSRR